ncbi:hypothetical protein [Serinibacter arcticus]|uniref:Uncharacterized protein n=1 Tax=Serinibacter arcticus TaxID=1655435 RepID=A0A4Z1E782_9MICO|nr:hypothetical protein [Serinibacter arcticus]TGO05441.1 hypothetical protein SERN_1445 [Serinibacter arcticus]
MGWLRRGSRTVEVAEGFVALEALAHQAALETSAGTGRAPGAAQRLPAELTVHAEGSGVVVLAWHNRNVGIVPPGPAVSLAAQAAAAGRARLLVNGEVFRDDGVWRVWVGPLPRPRDVDVPRDTVAAKPPTIVGIPLQRPDGARD